MKENNQNSKKVIVALSGGVDSALTAALMQEQGYDVHCLFMQNWDAQDPHCSATQDLADAQAVCHQLNLTLDVVNFTTEYWNSVFSRCLDEFAKGVTPNPDVLCNREIKFKHLLKHALSLGADQLATGHYAQIRETDNGFELHKGLDNNKDQSYFLYLLNQDQLSKAAFPLGKLDKSAVRAHAEKRSLPNARKKDSTGICFVGERRFKPFLQEYLAAQPGPIVTLEGSTIGQHDGIMFYTIGQRQGLQIGGLKDHKEGAWYVVDKRCDTNELVVAQGANHPSLCRSECRIMQTHWISGSAPQEPIHCHAKIRYRQRDTPCSVYLQDNGHCQIRFESPQQAITPGQSLVLYSGTQCLGGGIIQAFST